MGAKENTITIAILLAIFWLFYMKARSLSFSESIKNIIEWIKGGNDGG